MGNIKEYKELTQITLKSGEVIVVENSIKEVAELLNDREQDYITLGGIGFSRLTGVQEFKKFIPTEFDGFILSQSDLKVRDRLRKILRERKEKGFTTRSTEHLWSIYENRYLQNNESGKGEN